MITADRHRGISTIDQDLIGNGAGTGISGSERKIKIAVAGDQDAAAGKLSLNNSHCEAAVDQYIALDFGICSESDNSIAGIICYESRTCQYGIVSGGDIEIASINNNSVDEQVVTDRNIDRTDILY